MSARMLEQRKLSSNFANKMDAGGEPSTWFPPGGLVELITKPNETRHKVLLNSSGSSSG